MEIKNIDIKVNDISIKGEVYLINPSPDNYNMGYSLFIPENCEVVTTLILGACNSSYTNSFNLKDALKVASESTCEQNLSMWLASDLKMPLLTPHIPRVHGFFAQALGSRIYKNDVSLIKDAQSFDKKQMISDDEIAEIKKFCYDLPLQVVNIIEDAKKFLEAKKINVEEKIIIEGYSTGSKFANLFTALYPKLIKLLISGGGTGLGIIPLKNYKGEELNFPLGVNDLPEFDFESFKNVKQLYYIGNEDNNDPAIYKRKMINLNGVRVPELDSKGNDIPIIEDDKYIAGYSDNYTDSEVHIIHTLLGSDVQERFDNQERIYEELGVNSVFRKFPGNHSSLTSYNKGDQVNEYKKEIIKEILIDNKKSNRLN